MISVKPENARTMREWIKNRGGIAVWKSIDLSNPDLEILTPCLTIENEPYSRPYRSVSNVPSEIVKSEDQVIVSIAVEVKRFHVAIRQSSNGLSMKCTDASSSRIHAAVEKAGEGAYYEFDYETQEAVIYKPQQRISLSQFKE